MQLLDMTEDSVATFMVMMCLPWLSKAAHLAVAGLLSPWLQIGMLKTSWWRSIDEVQISDGGGELWA